MTAAAFGASQLGDPWKKGEEPEAAEGSLLQVEALRDVVLVGKEIHHTKSSEKKSTS